MAAPPNLPPVPTSDAFFGSFQPLTDTHYTAMEAHQLQNGLHNLVPPLAPTPPPAVIGMGPPTPTLPQQPQEALQERRRSADRSRNASQQGRSRSPSHSRSSEHSASDEGESDAEDTPDPRYQWRPIAEDKSEPCDDEMVYIQSRAATEHSALDHAHWEEQTFFELNDKHIKVLESARVDWLVEKFNGTKEEPNNERVMRSPTLHVGGYDWRIVFHPRGNNTDFLSLYIECVSMQQAEYTDLETFESPAFPFLAGESTEAIKKRRSVAAQVSVIMYNPTEPRSYEFKHDAHRYSKASADYGWRYFAHREDFYMRRHGQRQALLRGDKLAFSAYIRVVEDPTQCMWAHDHNDSFKESLLSTSLRPFSGQLPHLAALIPLLYFAPFRTLLTHQVASTSTIYNLQTLLWKLYSRSRSSGYGRRSDGLETTDAVSCLRSVVDALSKDCGEDALSQLLGSLDPRKGALVSTNKLQTKSVSSVQEAINKHPTPINTPALLAVELQRQEFDGESRKWRKLTNRVEIDDMIMVPSKSKGCNEAYHLYAVVTHVGELQSNKHNVYVRPVSPGLWYAYQDRRVRAMTMKPAVTDHEGFGGKESDREKRRDSPFRGILDVLDSELIYLALYARSELVAGAPGPREEAWTVPEEIRRGLQFPKQKEQPPPPTKADEPAEMPFRVEQI
ncbi:hypothetical protein LTR53_017738, partial [Teratosphaeriaceae sp. CCFEE 6253]